MGKHSLVGQAGVWTEHGVWGVIGFAVGDQSAVGGQGKELWRRLRGRARLGPHDLEGPDAAELVVRPEEAEAGSCSHSFAPHILGPQGEALTSTESGRRLPAVRSFCKMGTPQARQDKMT